MMLSSEVRPEVLIRNTALFPFVFDALLLTVLRTPLIRASVVVRLAPLHVPVAALLILPLPPFALRSRIPPVPTLRLLIPPVIRPGLLLRMRLRFRACLLLLWPCRLLWDRRRPALPRLLRSIRRPLARMLILCHSTKGCTEQERSNNPTYDCESLHT